ESSEFAANQRKQIINHFTTLNSSSADINMQRLNSSVYYDDSLNAMQMSGDEITRVGKSDIKQKITPRTSKRGRSVSINHNNDSQQIMGQHTPRTKKIIVTRIKSLSSSRQPRKNHETAVFPENAGEHTNYKTIVPSFQHQKSKTLSDRSNNRKIGAHVMS
ncbi:unnamed protein product, partial [Rotaria magnacalcarata]